MGCFNIQPVDHVHPGPLRWQEGHRGEGLWRWLQAASFWTLHGGWHRPGTFEGDQAGIDFGRSETGQPFPVHLGDIWSSINVETFIKEGVFWEKGILISMDILTEGWLTEMSWWWMRQENVQEEDHQANQGEVSCLIRCVLIHFESWNRLISFDCPQLLSNWPSLRI